MQFYILFYIFIWKVNQISASKFTDAQSLKNDILQGYDASLQPLYGEPLRISVFFILFSVRELSEVSGTLTTAIGVYYLWTDHRLTWNISDYNNLTEFYVKTSDVWYPELFCLNSASEMKAFGDAGVGTQLRFDGKVDRTVGAVLDTSCAVDMTYFPFDVQKCRIELAPWGHPPLVQLYRATEKLDFRYYTDNPRWEVIDGYMTNSTVGGYEGFVTIELLLQRKPGYFVINNLSPIILLLFLNPLIFILPLEDRSSYAVTIFLSLGVFMTLLGENMPKSANPIARLSYFLLASMVSSTCQCVMNMLILCCYSKHDKEDVHKFLRILDPKSGCKRRKVSSSKGDVKDISYLKSENESSFTWKEAAKQLDRITIIFSYGTAVVLIVLMFTMTYA